MLVPEPKENELNLEKIDMEIGMEKIRQNAVKLTWDGFGQSVRKNLLDKRFGFDADVRMDVLQAIAVMRKKMPFEENGSLESRLKQFAASIECSLQVFENGFLIKNTEVTIEIGYVDAKITACKIAYFDSPLFDCPEGVKMLKDNDLTQLRLAVFSILGMIPSNLSPQDRASCKKAVQALEHQLLVNASVGTFEALNTSPLGFFCPRTLLRPGRIYYTVEPSYVMNVNRPNANDEDFAVLPFLEISFVACENTCPLPEMAPNGEWRGVNEANACVCIRFSHALLFSQATTRRLEKLIARSSLVRHYTNLYRYMASRDPLTEDVVMRTRLPAEYTQHRYEVDVQSLKNDNDPVLVEIYIKDLSKLSEVINIIRSQWQHNSMWESMLAMCHGQWKGSESLRIKTVLSRKLFEFVFSTPNGLVNVQVQETSDRKWEVKCVYANGRPVDSSLDDRMTKQLRRTWSIPVTLVMAIEHLGCAPTADDASDEKKEIGEALGELSLSKKSSRIDIDKVGRAWLSEYRNETNMKHAGKERVDENEKETIVVKKAERGRYERQQDRPTRGGFLAMFKQVDESLRLESAKADSRTKRMESTNNANVFSDLERIRMLAEADNDEEKKTPSSANRLMDNPLMNSSLRQQQMSGSQMSPLDAARLHMKQSMSVATAVALANHTPTSGSQTPNVHGSGGGGGISSMDIFDFPPDDSYRSPSSGFSTPSPAQLSFLQQQQHMQMQNMMMQQQTARGNSTKTRRPRGRKSANMGEQRMSVDSATMSPFSMSPTTPTMGAAPATTGRGSRGGGSRRSRGGGGSSRKGGGLTQLEQMIMDTNRPQLQRSFSDFPYGSMTPQQNQMSSPASSTQYVEEDSDDECDPPPPPKPLTTVTPLQMLQQQQQQQQRQMPLQSPTNQPHTPSPLSMPAQRQQAWQQATQQDVKPDVNLLNQLISNEQKPPTSEATTPTQQYTQWPPPPLSSSQQPSQMTGTGGGSRKKSLEAVVNRMKAGGGSSTMVGQQRNNSVSLSDIFDDGTAPSPTEDKKPQISQLQQALMTPATSSISTQPTSHLAQMLASTTSLRDSIESMESSMKKNELENKLVSKAAKSARNSPSVDQQLAKEKSSKSSSSMSGMPRLEKQEKRKKEESKERSRSKKEEKEKGGDGPKKRKLEASKKEGTREPREKKSKNSSDPQSPTVKGGVPLINPMSMMPSLSLKNFRIPKKETNEEPAPEPAASTSTTTPAAPPSGSAPTSSVPAPQRPGPSVVPPNPSRDTRDIRDEGPLINKKKNSTASLLPTPPTGPIGGGGYGMGPAADRGGGSRKGRKPPPLPRAGPPMPPMGMYGPPGGGPPRGFPPGYPPPHYQQQKQVASYAQGIPHGFQGGPPSGMGGPPGGQWVRPPTMQHGPPHHQGPGSLGIDAKPPPPPPPKEKGMDEEPPSPEETLRIADD